MADSGTITFSAPALEAVTGELAGILDALTSSVERLHAEVLTACGQWEGEAREAFVVLMDEWKRQEADLREQQKRLHDAVAAARTGYLSAHGAVRRAWGAA